MKRIWNALCSGLDVICMLVAALTIALVIIAVVMKTYHACAGDWGFAIGVALFFLFICAAGRGLYLLIVED